MAMEQFVLITPV